MKDIYRKRLFPAGSYYRRADDCHVEVPALLLHQVLSQGFGVGVGIGSLTEQLRGHQTDQLIVHPPEHKQNQEFISALNQGYRNDSHLKHLLQCVDELRVVDRWRVDDLLDELSVTVSVCSGDVNKHL